MDFATRKRLYNLCNPSEPLEPVDARNIDIDKLAGGVRGDDWLGKVLRRLQLSDEPLCELLTGLPGSGKTTELKRLLEKLEDPHRDKLLGVYIDAEQVVDLTNPIDVPDLLGTIVEATERKVLEVEGRDPNARSRTASSLASGIGSSRRTSSLPKSSLQCRTSRSCIWSSRHVPRFASACARLWPCI